MTLDSRVKYQDVVAIMRANPPHVNHTGMLKELCRQSRSLRINLGSSNKFNNKNPFKIEEREEMMKLALYDFDNFQLVRLPDVNDDEAWFKNLCKLNKGFTEIMSNNPYDMKIYKGYQYEKGHEGDNKFRKYNIITPEEVFPKDRMIYAKSLVKDGAIFVPLKQPLYVSGTFVRAAMINNWNWETFVDRRVADYIKENNLIDRLRDTCPELIDKPVEELYEGR